MRLVKYFERLGEEFGLILTNISVNFPCIQNQTCLHFFQHATFYVVSHPCTKLKTYLLIFSVVSFLVRTSSCSLLGFTYQEKWINLDYSRLC